MFCNQCGESLKENSKFCTKCGSRMETNDSVSNQNKDSISKTSQEKAPSRINNNVLIYKGMANHCTIFLAIGGKLELYNDRLNFIRNKIDVGKKNISINVKDILKVEKAYTFTIFFLIPIPNAFKVTLRNGQEYKFTVYKRKIWINNLMNVMNRR